MTHNGGVNMILLVIHVCGLGLEVNTSIQAYLLVILELVVISCHQVGVVIILTIRGILGILNILEVLQCIESWEIAQIELFGSIKASILRLSQQRVDTVHRAVAIGVTILELIAGLKVKFLGNRLGV